MNTEYKGYIIESGYIRNYYSVFYQGDELLFSSVEEAKNFIDNEGENNNENIERCTI